MNDYVLGFYFYFDIIDMEWFVILIKHSHDISAGLLNGVVGLVGESESPVDAMVREFEGQVGISTDPNDWHGVLSVRDGDRSRMTVFSTVMKNANPNKYQRNSKGLVISRAMSAIFDSEIPVSNFERTAHWTLLASFYQLIAKRYTGIYGVEDFEGQI